MSVETTDRIPHPNHSDSPRRTPRRKSGRNLLEIAFLTAVLFIVAGFSAVLFNASKTREVEALRSQLVDQQVLNTQLSRGLDHTPDTKKSGTEQKRQRLADQVSGLVAQQDRLSGDLAALNAALASVIVERDQLREQVDLLEESKRQQAAPANSTDSPKQAEAVAVALRSETAAATGADGKPVQATAPTQPATVPAFKFVPGRGLRLDQVHFSPSSARLSPSGKRKTKQAAEQFIQQGKERIRLFGFSDSVGGAVANQRLAKKRAAAVAGALMRAGVPGTRIDIISKGEQNAPEKTADGVDEPLNRCVGIFATDEG